MKLLYFAWLKERLGFGEETVKLPSHVKTVADLMDWLAQRNEIFAELMASDGLIRVAVDQQHVANRNANISEAREIALFPPMTGG